MSDFILKYKSQAIIISAAVLVLLYVIVFYEATRRNITSASNERIALLQQEVATLFDVIAVRDMHIEEITNDLERTQFSVSATRHSLSRMHDRHSELQRQFNTMIDWRERYLRRSDDMWILHDLGIYCMYAPIITTLSADPYLVDTIVRHLTAMYTGDLEAYLATVVGGDTWEYPGIAADDDGWFDWDGDWTWTDWMLLTFRRISEREYYRMSVRVVPGWSHSFVRVLVQPTPNCEPFLTGHSLHLSRYNGVWRVHDYH